MQVLTENDILKAGDEKQQTKAKNLHECDERGAGIAVKNQRPLSRGDCALYMALK
jgi:hypothetical protein